MTFICCYDIANGKRLRKTAKTLQKYSIRIQKSIFQFEEGHEVDRNLLFELLTKNLDRKEDSLVLFPLSQQCKESLMTFGLIQLQDNQSPTVY